MNILLKHTLNSAKRNKIQVIMIIITITIVALAVFVSFSMNDIFYNIQSVEFERLQQDSNFMLHAEYDPTNLFSGSKIHDFIDEYPDDFENVELFLRLSGALVTDEDTQIINIEATDITSYLKRHPLKAVSVSNGYLNYEKAIISEKFASDKKIGIGDTLKIFVPGINDFCNFSVYAIAENEGVFSSPGGLNILTERRILGLGNLYNCAIFKLKQPSETKINMFLEILREDYPQFLVYDYSNFDAINSIVNNNTLLLSIGIIFIMIMMSLILFSSYLIIAKQRVSEMVIFKASGATPRQTFAILMGEVLLYGIIGSIIGVILGRIVMHFMINYTLPGATKSISFQWYKYLLSIIITLAAACLSTLSPIIKSSKKTIRELTSSGTKEIKYLKPSLLIFLAIFIIAVLAVFSIVKSNYIILLLIVLLPLIALLVYFLTPYLILLFSKTANKINRPEARLASVSLKRNTSAQMIAVLLSIVISFSFMITEVINLVEVAITPFNSRFNAEYVIVTEGDLDYGDALYIKQKYENYADIKKVIVYQEFSPIMIINNKEYNDHTFFSINPDDVNNFTSVNIDQEVLDRFENTVGGIILNNDLAIRYKLSIGDKISLMHTFNSPEGMINYPFDTEFTVVGFDYTVTEFDKVAFIRESDHAFSGKKVNNFKFLLTSDNPNVQTFANIRDSLMNDNNIKGVILRFDEWAYIKTKGLEGLPILLTLVQLLINLITFLGVVNIMVVTFFDRKNEFKIFKNSGLTDKDYKRLAVAESAILGICGMILSVILSLTINTIMPIFTTIIQKYLTFDFFPISIPILSAVCGIVFIVLWYIISIGIKHKLLKYDSYNDRQN